MKVEVEKTKLILDDSLKVSETHYCYQTFSGEMSDEVRKLTVKRPDAIAAIVYHTGRQEYIMAKQFRYAAYLHGDGWLTELVAGVMDDGEGEEKTLERELEEEIGYKPAHAEKITTFYTAPGYSPERIHLFYVEVNDETKVSEGGGLKDENENIQAVYYSLEEIKTKLQNNEWNDAKTIIGYYYLLNKRMV